MVKRALAIAAVLVAIVPMHVSAKNSPITINSCQPILHNNQLNTPAPNTIYGVLQPQQSSGMRIQFTNETSKVADLVNFDVRSNGVQFVIRDVGTFSPGITIDHNFRNGAGQAFILPEYIPPNVKCHVASVRFTDGTVWPDTAATTQSSSLMANPSSVTMASNVDSTLVMVSTNGTVAGFTEKNDCTHVAAISVATTSQASAVYLLRPIAKGSCTMHVTDEGRTVSVPVTVQ